MPSHGGGPEADGGGPVKPKVSFADDKGRADADEGQRDDLVWVALEPGGGVKAGQEVLRNAGDPTLKDRGLHTCSDGSIIALKQVTVEEAAEGAGAPRSHELAGEDARLMTPVVYDANGVRWREFPEAVTLLRSEALEDFPLEGERSFAWLAKYIKDHGRTPDGRQTKWASEQHIGKETSAYVLHDLCGLAIELCLCYDQLDGSNLACMEVVGRM